MARVDLAVDAAIERAARGAQVDRRGNGGRAAHDRARRVAALAQPFEKRIAAQGNADGVNRRREFPQDPVDFLAVAGVIGPRLAVRLAGAAAPVRHRQPPSARERVRGERARVVAVGAAFEAVEQHQQARGSPLAGEVDVDEIAVRRFPALALQCDTGRRMQRRVDGLQVPARQPPGGRVAVQ